MRWLAAAGPWHLWTVCPALVAPHSPIAAETARPDTAPLVEALARTLAHGHTLVALDLNPVMGVHVAAQINQRGLAHVVLLLPRWPYDDAVLPTRELTRVLVECARSVVFNQHSTNVVFVLDAQRGTAVGRPHRDARADNRYRLSPADLPNLAALRAHRVERVVRVYRQ
jgi:hypothetical protein